MNCWSWQTTYSAPTLAVSSPARLLGGQQPPRVVHRSAALRHLSFSRSCSAYPLVPSRSGLQACPAWGRQGRQFLDCHCLRKKSKSISVPLFLPPLPDWETAYPCLLSTDGSWQFLPHDRRGRRELSFKPLLMPSGKPSNDVIKFLAFSPPFPQARHHLADPNADRVVLSERLNEGWEMTQAVSGCGGGSSRDRIRLQGSCGGSSLSRTTTMCRITVGRTCWKLFLQDFYHVPDHRSWQDLFCTPNQLNKVWHVWSGSNDFMGVPSNAIKW